MNETTQDSDYILFASMDGFTSLEQEDLLKPFTEKYFNDVLTVFERRPNQFASGFFTKLKPLDSNDAILAKFEDLQKKVKPEQKTLLKLVRNEIDDIRRNIRNQKLFLEH